MTDFEAWWLGQWNTRLASAKKDDPNVAWLGMLELYESLPAEHTRLADPSIVAWLSSDSSELRFVATALVQRFGIQSARSALDDARRIGLGWIRDLAVFTAEVLPGLTVLRLVVVKGSFLSLGDWLDALRWSVVAAFPWILSVAILFRVAILPWLIRRATKRWHHHT